MDVTTNPWVLIPAGVAALGAAVLGYFGTFRRVQVREESVGPLVLLAVRHHGPHHTVGAAFNKLREGVKKGGVDDSLGHAGIYYGDPSQTPADRLESRVAVVVPEDRAEAELEKARGPGGLEGAELIRVPAQKFALADFPFRNEVSNIVATLKCYPAIERFLEAHGGETKLPEGVMPGSLELYPIHKRFVQIGVPLKAAPPMVLEAGASKNE